ncbi:HET-domain-containing protein [Poronia punctata]|nr:HET-domain-containing protein [Poronia punctata]
MSVQYKRLNSQKQQIRLLQLLPASGPKYARIPRCQLVETSLSEKQHYSALSYAWGKDERNRVIVVDNIPIRIPQNLYDALMTLRPTDDPVTLWVDYICINQKDRREKSWQVELIKDIYGQAKEVLAWLGEGDEKIDQTVDFLDSFGKSAMGCGFHKDAGVADTIWEKLASPSLLKFKGDQAKLAEMLCADLSRDNQEPAYATWFRRVSGLSSAANISKLIDLFRDISGWHSQDTLFPVAGMEELFERGYWERVWVLQEITVSSRTEFLCGSKRIPRARLSAALAAYVAFAKVLMGKQRTNDCANFTEYHQQITQKLFHARPTIMTNARRNYLEGRFPLIELLRLTCFGTVNPHSKAQNLEASDPRDKIFALLGLATDREELERKGVRPDYTKSVQDVYVLATAALLQQGHVSLLSYVQYPKVQGYLPSWVPDWSNPITETLQMARDSRVSSEYQFRVSGDPVQPPEAIVAHGFNLATTSFSLHGNVYDKVGEIGRLPPRTRSNGAPLSDTETLQWLAQWLIENLSLTYRTENGFSKFEQRLQAAARNSVGGTTFTGRSGAVSKLTQPQYDEAAFLLQYGIDNARGKPVESRIQDEARAFLARGDVQDKFKRMDKDALGLVEEMAAKSLGRVPFVTANGHLGLSRDNIQKGDCVTVFKGAQVPYLLRPESNGTYQLISEAHIDGIMDGEICQGMDFARISLV